MSEEFGSRRAGTRVCDGGGFYAVPAADAAAGAIFMPAYATSPQFGVAETETKAGSLGWFATDGTFAFAAPASHVSQAGQAIYYAPTSATTGTLSTTSSKGAVLLGREVVRPGIPEGLIYVVLERPAALQS